MLLRSLKIPQRQAPEASLWSHNSLEVKLGGQKEAKAYLPIRGDFPLPPPPPPPLLVIPIISPAIIVIVIIIVISNAKDRTKRIGDAGQLVLVPKQEAWGQSFGQLLHHLQKRVQSQSKRLQYWNTCSHKRYSMLGDCPPVFSSEESTNSGDHQDCLFVHRGMTTRSSILNAFISTWAHYSIILIKPDSIEGHINYIEVEGASVWASIWYWGNVCAPDNQTARHSLPRPPPNNLYPDPGHFDDDDDVLADKLLLPINWAP